MPRRSRRGCWFYLEVRGIEPLTSCMPCKRSSQLSYTPKDNEIIMKEIPF